MGFVETPGNSSTLADTCAVEDFFLSEVLLFTRISVKLLQSISEVAFLDENRTFSGLNEILK